MTREPFPLQWPDGWPRTADDQREQSNFGSIRQTISQYTGSTFKTKGPVSLVDECHETLRQLNMLGAANGVITSNLPTKSNGMPYATGRTDDPGIAVWWVLDGREQVMACDRWVTPAENLRAINKTIDALRGIERWGSSTIVQKAFAGFAALPPAGETTEGTGKAEPPPEPTKAWTDYFHVSEAASRTGIKAMYRSMAQQLHPDRNKGDSVKMAELNVAWDQAAAWFDWRDAVMGVEKED